MARLTNKKLHKPKRQLTSYNLWFKHNHVQLKRENPDYSAPQILKLAGERWRQLEDKSEWISEAERLRRIYRKDTEKPKSQSRIHIKRPSTPFLLYLTSKRREIKQKYPGASVTQIAMIGGEMWRQSKSKVVWKILAKVQRKQYLKKVTKIEAASLAKRRGNKAQTAEKKKKAVTR